MCGRYSIASKLENIQKKFHAEFTFEYKPVFNCAPSLLLPVILSESKTKISQAKWGFVPNWETNINKGYINARGEGIHTSKAFLKSIRERRCLVIANCFYEWGKKNKQPYLIYSEDQQLFAFAGLYRPYVNKETGEVTNTFAILTTAPNKLMGIIDHHRMPVILKPSDYQEWLKVETPLKQITKIAEKQYSNLNAYPVDKMINKPANNTKEIMNPIGDRIIIEVESKPVNNGIRRGKDNGDSNIKPLGER